MLSFPLADPDAPPPAGAPLLLGDVVLAFETVAREAAEQRQAARRSSPPSRRARRPAPARLRPRDATPRPRSWKRARSRYWRSWGCRTRIAIPCEQSNPDHLSSMSDTEPPASDGQPEHQPGTGGSLCAAAHSVAAAAPARDARDPRRAMDALIAGGRARRRRPDHAAGAVPDRQHPQGARAATPPTSWCRASISSRSISSSRLPKSSNAWSSTAIRACRSIARRSMT